MPTFRETDVLRWLHVTDLHVGKNNESQAAALASLLDAVKRFGGTKPFDVVFLTGDLAFSGQKSQYELLQVEFIDRLRRNPLTADARLIAVPGNHDMDCDVEYPPIWRDLGRPRQEKFFHMGDDGRRTRGARTKAFGEYSSFMQRASVDGVDPLVEPAKLILLKGHQRSVAVVCAVTAFFSDKDVQDWQKSPAPVHPIRTLTQNLPADTQLIILGHHPVEWFTQESQRHFHSLLVEKNAIYLHGHEHQVRSEFGARGLTAMGFGAAYVAPSDSPPAPFYRNSFGICELTESLHLFVVSWDAENGQWRSEQQLPGDFVERSDRLPDGYRFSLGSTRLAEHVAHHYSPIASAIRANVQFGKSVWLAKDHQKRWTELLLSTGLIREVSETFSLPTQALPAGHSEFRVRDQRGQHLIYAVSGHGDVLNYEQIQAVNTELDRHDYESCIIITLGDLAGEARTLAHQLASRKPITILERSEVVRRILQNVSPGMEMALKGVLEEDLSAACLVFTDNGLALLIQERTANAWFQVFGEDGTLAPESAELVLALRKELPGLRSVRYRSPNYAEAAKATPPTASVTFNREDYLRRSHDYFDDVRYAPLAALGFRFRKASLSEIYVEASADVGGSTKASLTLTRAVSEFVETLSLPPAQRDQLESQLRSRHGLTRTAEVGAARKLYQRYNNVVVLGDPGSGKTCFVQHEILAYCDATKDSSNWYSQHLPVYVSLAEAARLLDGKTSLLDICEIVSSRRGIDLPRSVIESGLADGRIAFFFDGLDEVGFIDKRIALLSEIDSLVKAHAPRGNRFVLASRPAAVQPVEIPEALTYLHLKGLTENEIRVLAGRVLTTRVAEQSGSVLSEEETELVNRLLEDTHNSPGIARIARNPLLLTLLVLTYANTGALSARRHVIYTQAIKTLVSVRGRQTREQRISETDLRGRLGALALAIFRREIAEIPKRSEVLALLGPLVTAQSKSGSSLSHADVADSFLQEVAEASGLLTIHSRDDGRSEDLVTFMHYSFLEYYAAAGLLARDYLTIVPELAGNPRWRDVTTLLFGILSEQGNITELLDRILSDDSPVEAISQYKTILAIDCANECDVPPEIAQARVAAAVYETISQGAGRYSVKVRTEIAHRLQALFRGAGPRIEAAIAQGLRESNPIAAAAFADLVARVDDDLALPDGIVEAFASCLQNENAVTRAACLFAIELRPELRDDRAKQIVKLSLKGSLVEKHAALKAIAAVPQFGEPLRDDLRYLLDDPSTLISATAAQCLLAGVLRGSHFLEKPPFLEKALSKLDQDAGQEAGLALRGITFDRGIVQDLIRSDDNTKVELAIRHVSLVKGDDQFVYAVLIENIRNAKSDRHKAAALSTLLNCEAAIELITIADTDVICSALKDPTRNVRIAAAKLLGEMPDDEQVVRSLQDYLERSAAIPSREDEVTEAAKALAKHVRRNPRIRQQTIKTLTGLLPKNPQDGFGDPSKQSFIVALLSVCESIGGAADNAVAWRLNRIAEDYKAPLPIRRQAIRSFGRMAEPSAESAMVFVRALQRDDRRLNDAVYAGAAAFVSQCHRRVEYVRRVHEVLQALLSALCDAWKREISRSLDTIEPPALREIRDGIVEIRNLRFAYEEFSERAKLTS